MGHVPRGLSGHGVLSPITRQLLNGWCEARAAVVNEQLRRWFGLLTAAQGEYSTVHSGRLKPPPEGSTVTSRWERARSSPRFRNVQRAPGGGAVFADAPSRPRKKRRGRGHEPVWLSAPAKLNWGRWWEPSFTAIKSPEGDDEAESIFPAPAVSQGVVTSSLNKSMASSRSDSRPEGATSLH